MWWFFGFSLELVVTSCSALINRELNKIFNTWSFYIWMRVIILPFWKFSFNMSVWLFSGMIIALGLWRMMVLFSEDAYWNRGSVVTPTTYYQIHRHIHRYMYARVCIHTYTYMGACRGRWRERERVYDKILTASESGWKPHGALECTTHSTFLSSCQFSK